MTIDAFTTGRLDTRRLDDFDTRPQQGQLGLGIVSQIISLFMSLSPLKAIVQPISKQEDYVVGITESRQTEIISTMNYIRERGMFGVIDCSGSDVMVFNLPGMSQTLRFCDVQDKLIEYKKKSEETRGKPDIYVSTYQYITKHNEGYKKEYKEAYEVYFDAINTNDFSKRRLGPASVVGDLMGNMGGIDVDLPTEEQIKMIITGLQLAHRQKLAGGPKASVNNLSEEEALAMFSYLTGIVGWLRLKDCGETNFDREEPKKYRKILICYHRDHYKISFVSSNISARLVFVLKDIPIS